MPDTRGGKSSSTQEQATPSRGHGSSLPPASHASYHIPYIDGPKMDWTFDDSLYKRYLTWKLKCENLLGVELAHLPEDMKCKKVISWSGDDGLDQFVSWDLPQAEISLHTIWTKFEEYCKPQSNEARARFDLLTSFRQGSRTVDEWYNAVRQQIKLCNYPQATASIMERDIFWFFMSDQDFISKTLTEGQADLNDFPASRLRQLAKKLESSKATAKHMKSVTSNPQAAQVNILRHNRTQIAPKHKKSQPKRKPRQQDDRQAPFNPSKKQYKPPQAGATDRCTKCGDSKHAPGFNCPAKRYQCKACSKYGHFTHMCFTKQKQAPRKPPPAQAHLLSVQDLDTSYEADTSYDDDSFELKAEANMVQAQVNRVQDTTKPPKRLYANIPYKLKPTDRHHKYLRLRLDTCADVNVMPASVYKLIFNDHSLSKLAPSNLELTVLTGHSVDLLGTCTLQMIHPDTKQAQAAVFYVSSDGNGVLLSCATTLALGLLSVRPRLNYLPPRATLITSDSDHPSKTKIQAVSKKRSTAPKQVQEPYNPPQATTNLITSKDQILQEYPDVFQGIGCFPGPPYSIKLDTSIPPKQTPCRPIPVHLKQAFKQEIDKMLQAGILKPVHEATPWINSFVLVESKNKLTGEPKLRICLDPTNLNKAIIREPYCFRTPEDIAHLLANACVITVGDCTKGFWHQKLDEASSYLTTMNTELGRFRWTVMPFGATVAGDVFQRKLDTIFNKLNQVIVIADDIMVVGYSKDHSDHDQAFTSMLATCRSNNVKLNYDKLQYKQTQVEFFGELYTTTGRKPSPSKVKAVTSMPTPTNVKELQCFIGMATYLSKFTARLSELAQPLRELTRKNAPFQWGPEHDQAYASIKKEITSAPILAYYDPKKPTTLQTDASLKGLGAVLLQEGHPVYFASKALHDAEQGYVAIELEALAVAWSMEKFHHFLYASHFMLETDQKPLEAILAKSLNQATPRMQRLLLRTFPYDFTVKYIEGPTNQLADCLSRLGCLKDRIVLPKLQVHAITSQVRANSDKLQEIRLETAQDDELALLKHTITTGWPKHIQDLPREMQAYWNFREELTVEDGLVLKNTRIVIPAKLRQSTLKQIHEGHLGLKKCQARAKCSVYWPGLYAELQDLVLNCPICLKFSQAKRKPKQAKNNLGQEIPLVPWTKLATDIFHFEGDSYLLVVDYTSRFPIVRKLTSMTGKAIARHMQAIFAEQSAPETLVSDNGPCYTSQEFQQLMQALAINHITSSPHYPQSNGLAEKYVQIVKSLFKKAKEEGKSYDQALYIYRTTPLDNSLQSPMQLLQNRTGRLDLPLSKSAQAKMGIHPADAIRTKDKHQATTSHDYTVGQHVMFQNPPDKRWYPAKITSLAQAKRSYIITSADGAQYRRTQAHLKPFKPRDKQVQPERNQVQPDRNPPQAVPKPPQLAAQGATRPKREIKRPTKLDL